MRLRLSRVLVASTALTLALAAAASAAPPIPAHWTIEPLKRAIAPGAAFSLTLTVQIQPGWHLYALEEPEGGPLPTEIGLAQGDPLSLLDVTEPEPHKIPDPVTHALAGLFQNTVSFTLKVRAPRTKLQPGTVSHVLVRYQTCNDQVCLPPRTEVLALPLQGIVR